jgi:hypothetical protein
MSTQIININMDCRDFSCKKIAENCYLVFLHKDNQKIEVGGFSNRQMFIYPNYKGCGLGTIIKSFMEDIKSK